MNRFILPFERVEDNNGHPLDGAKLYFYENGTTTLKDTYSDETRTILNANPVIADGNGQFPNIYMSSEFYTVDLQNKDGVSQAGYPADNVSPPTVAGTIKSEIIDNVNTLRTGTVVAGSSVLLQSHTTLGDGGGGEFIGYTGAPAGTYVDDNGTVFVPTGGDGSAAWVRQEANREGVNARWFGLKSDFNPATGVGTDNTAALQRAINYAAKEGKPLVVPDGSYKYSRLYCYHDATLNPDFPTTAPSRSVIIMGYGHMARQDWKRNNFKGTVLHSSATTGDCFNVGNGTGAITGATIKNISFTGSTDGRLFNFDYLGSFNLVENVFIGNDMKAGTAMYVASVWISAFKNVDIVGNKAFVNATPTWATGSTGLHFDGGGGGNVLWENVTTAFFDDSTVMGKTFNSANAIAKNHTMINCQAHYSNNGLHIKHGMYHSDIVNHWGEHNENYDLKISNSASNIHVKQGTLASTSTTTMVGNIVTGDNSGVAGVDACYAIKIENLRFGHVVVVGLRKYATAIDVTVERCTFKNNGGKAILVDPTEAAELELIQNDYFPRDASNEFTGFNKVHDGTGSSAHLCHKIDFESPVNLTANFDMSTWRRLPQALYVSTLGGNVTLTLPTVRSSIQDMRLEVLKLYGGANSLIIDAGAGNVVAPAGTQTHTLTAAGSSVVITPARATYEWIVK